MAIFFLAFTLADADEKRFENQPILCSADYDEQRCVFDERKSVDARR